MLLCFSGVLWFLVVFYLQDYYVPHDEQIEVQAGDMFGVHYPKSAVAANEGVVYLEDSRYCTVQTV